MSKGKLLAIGSNADKIEVHGGVGRTGQYIKETVVPIRALRDAGYDVVLATPKGTQPHIDPASRAAAHFDGDEATFHHAEPFLVSNPSMIRVCALRSAIDDGLENYVGFFEPGGQAPVVDLKQDKDLR